MMTEKKTPLWIFQRTGWLAGLIVSAAVSATAFAQEWIDAPLVTSEVVNGTLGSVPVKLSSYYPSGTRAPGVAFNIQTNTAPGYNIWDNNIPQNNAKLYPAAAVNATRDIVLLTQSRSTPADPHRVRVSFGSPVVNPTLLFFSIDTSTLDFSSAVTASGAAAELTMTTNPPALVTGKSVTKNPAATTTQPDGDEGCRIDTARACGVVQFTGVYDEITFDVTGADGIGMQIGAGVVPDAQKSARSVPSLSGAGLMTMILSMVGLGGWFARRRIAG